MVFLSRRKPTLPPWRPQKPTHWEGSQTSQNTLTALGYWNSNFTNASKSLGDTPEQNNNQSIQTANTDIFIVSVNVEQDFQEHLTDFQLGDSWSVIWQQKNPSTKPKSIKMLHPKERNLLLLMLLLVLRQSSTEGLQVPQKQRTKSCNVGGSNSCLLKGQYTWSRCRVRAGTQNRRWIWNLNYDPVISKPKTI